jgi:endonuclease/exonuclease/phosphatase family metal-dependent hydrolase
MDIRVVTFNTAAGNPRITTPQASFLELPFYREALEGVPGAPVLALQEVGDAQAKALRAARTTARIIQMRRPGLGNALVVPARFEVLASRRGYYLLSHLRGVVDALRWWRGQSHKPNWRQFGELRIWLEARLRDRESRRTFTVLTTHLSVEPGLKRRQARAIVERALAARRHGPVVLAGDLNVPASGASGRDVEIAATLARLRDMGSGGRPDIDYVLADGFKPVSSRRWTGDSLALPGSPNAETVSDHYAKDALLCFDPTT